VDGPPFSLIPSWEKSIVFPSRQVRYPSVEWSLLLAEGSRNAPCASLLILPWA